MAADTLPLIGKGVRDRTLSQYGVATVVMEEILLVVLMWMKVRS